MNRVFAPIRAGFVRLMRDRAAVAMTEFALTLPFLLGLGLMGMETANRALIQMQISQLAVHVADNASRIGDRSILEDTKIYERQINDLFYGAEIQAGSGLGLYEHGRVILSSLEVVPDTEDQQYIHWQRCLGSKRHTSSYGEEGDGLTGTDFPGMGPAGEEVLAFPREAVMFVEVVYDYQPIIGAPFTYDEDTVSAIASFTVRDARDLSRIYQRDPGDPDPVASCDTYGGSPYSTL
ncbi:TadE/TadG family type IV pilus assembly protein [Aurantiacibacter spongiae]|uniref:Pilus assembly protein n=1 Tax=Aurantiacibacter spongiae TaxID=2488860 RepID=A0A3N5CUN9_9SPHN|nr:hypothetical protein [Aurantiacibacter spongiae]RPF70339.1 hypothetical protein EG799_00850 [Aurantiacibacter spongiae]